MERMSRTQGRVNRTHGRMSRTVGRGRKMQKSFFGDGTLTLREAEGAWRMLRKLPLSDCCSDLVLNGALWRCVVARRNLHRIKMKHMAKMAKRGG